MDVQELRAEISNHLEGITQDAGAYIKFLATMARYHKYKLAEQINLHYHAPAGARAVAPREVWSKAFHTELADDAVAIPVVVSEGNDTYTIREVYDVQDTKLYRERPELLRNIPWQFNGARDEGLAKEVFQYPHADSLAAAIHERATALVRSDPNARPADLITHSVEYVVRRRLGLPDEGVMPEGMAPENYQESVYTLAFVNQFAGEMLTALGKEISARDRKATQEAESNDRRRDSREALRAVGRDAQEIPVRGVPGRMAADAHRGNPRSISNGNPANIRGAGGDDDRGTPRAGGRDGDPQTERRGRMDGTVQQRPRRGERDTAVRADAAVPRGAGDRSGDQGEAEQSVSGSDHGSLSGGTRRISRREGERVDRTYLPESVDANTAQKFFEELHTAREEGHITREDARDMYLSFVRPAEGAESLSRESRDEMIVSAYSELGKTFAVGGDYQGVQTALFSEDSRVAPSSSEMAPDNVSKDAGASQGYIPIENAFQRNRTERQTGYYSLRRITDENFPVAQSGNNILFSEQYDTPQYVESIGREAWGYIVYQQPLSPQDAARYELIMEGSAVTDSSEHVQESAVTVGDMAEGAVTDEGHPDSSYIEDVPADGEVIDARGDSVDDIEEYTEEDLADIDLDADMSTTTGKRAVFRRNLAAIRIANRLERTGDMPGEREMSILKAYSGFGGLPEVFDAHNMAWHEEYEEAKNVMTDVEFAAARASTLDAFYTPPEIIETVYAALAKAGFRGGNILDPSTGTGRFLNLMPEELRASSNRVGIELDILSAKIACHTTQGAQIITNGFEHTRFPVGAFDLAITNVPFGDSIITDAAYDKNYFVHDYFLLKMMDEVRAGGLVAAITSHGTMDKKDDSLRRELARRGELVRAIRFPNALFRGAGTDVCTDLLIFRKREKELAPDADMPDWVNSTVVEREIYQRGKEEIVTYNVNRRFIEHPEDVLGDLGMVQTAYGYTAGVSLVAGDVSGVKGIADQLRKQLDTIPSNVYTPLSEPLPIPVETPKPTTDQPYGYYEKDGHIVLHMPDGNVENMMLNKKDEGKVRSAMAIRDLIREMYDAELRDCDDAELAVYQTELNRLYETHAKTYGRFYEDKTFKRVFGDDASYPLLISLEIVEDGEYIGKSDIFTKRTIHAYRAPEHADTSAEALMISIQEKGRVDIPYMAELTGRPADVVVQDLEYSDIYEDIESNTYVTADEYLSGDVRGKIERLDEHISRLRAQSHAIAEEIVFPIPKRFEDDAPEASFPKERISEQGFVYYPISDEEKLLLFQPENRALFYRTMCAWSMSARTETFEYLYRSSPENKAVLDDPLFFLECERNNVTVVSPEIEANKIFKRASRYAQQILLGKDQEKYMTCMFQLLSGRAGKPTYLEEGDVRTVVDDVRENYEFRIDEEIRRGANPALLYLNEEIARASRNRAALDKVKPKDLTADEIKINLGATWIPTKDIKRFVEDVFEYRGSADLVQYAPASGEWKVDTSGDAVFRSNRVKLNSTYGTQGTNALKILEAALNHRQIRIMDENKRINEEATLLVAQKMDNLRDAFVQWVYMDEARKNRLVAYYNRHFNNLVPREYDGSRLTFPGMNPEIRLKQHQKDAVARSLYGGNTLFAHVVGAGKTFEMQASAMESKRIGLCKKSLMIMPGHLTEQFGAEFMRLYPNAKILVATPKDFQKDKRTEFFAKITSQDWDAVVMSYEQFGKIPLSRERREQFIKNEIDEVKSSMAALKESGGGGGFSVKEGERLLKKLRQKYEDIVASYEERQDAAITFEQLGVDRLYVDEAHFYKNLSFMTKIQGLSNTGAEKSSDLLAKIQYLNEITGERGVVFATGTPISNSMAELYTMQRYLRPSRLINQGLYHFDSWASLFGQEVTTMEIDPAGKGFRAKTRFSRFSNIPELMTMFREFADVRTAESLKLPVPEYEVNIVKADPSPLQKELVNDLAVRAKLIRQRRPIKLTEDANPSTGKGMDNMLVVIREGQNAALDPRIIDPEYADDPNSKVNLCVRNVCDIYRDTMDTQSTQVIFCDRSTPNGKAPFTVYGDIREKLIAKGIPGEQIAFIHDYDTPAKKEALFSRVRKGDVRILLGSSDKLGVGTNIQNKLIASHDLDCPWKPSQIEQRMGRIVRRGNENKQVKIFRYVTDGTFDSYMWQTNENKQRFISQVMTNRTTAREAEDVDEFTMTYAQLKAACTGNPLFKEQFELSNALQGLEAERAQYLEDQYRIGKRLENILPKEIRVTQEMIERYQKDVRTMVEHPEDSPVLLNGKTYHTSEEIGKALTECARAAEQGEQIHGAYRGLRLLIQRINHKIKMSVSGFATMEFPLGVTTPEVNEARLKSIRTAFLEEIPKHEAVLARERKDEQDCRESYGKPFPKEETYQTKKARLSEVNLLIEQENKREDEQDMKRLEDREKARQNCR